MRGCGDLFGEGGRRELVFAPDQHFAMSRKRRVSLYFWKLTTLKTHQMQA
jgi:hypothetical protein